MMHFTLSGVGLSVLAGFMYRYYSLRNELDFFHKKRAIIVIGAAIVLYPVPTLIPNWLQYRYSENDTRVLVQKYYPDLLYIYSHWVCSGFYDDLFLTLSIILAILQIFIVGFAVAYYAIKSIRLLKSLKESLTPTTYALQKQLLIVLRLQMIIPVICLVIPTTVLFIAMLAGSVNMVCKCNCQF